jgi:hypothetical protein
MIVIHWAYNLIGVLVSMNGYFYVANAVVLVVAAFLISRWWPAVPLKQPILGWSNGTPQPAKTTMVLPH